MLYIIEDLSYLPGQHGRVVHNLLELVLLRRLEQVVKHSVDDDLLPLRGGERQHQQLGGLLGAQDVQGLQLEDSGKRHALSWAWRPCKRV